VNDGVAAAFEPGRGDDAVRVGVVPYALRPRAGLGGIPISALDWPLGPPDVGSVLADLTPRDHVLVHPNTVLHFRPFGTRARVSLLIAEPSAIHAKHLRLLRLTHRRFHRILTRDPGALARFDNARRFVAAGTQIAQLDMPARDKTANVSLIASAKRTHEGHRLRHDLIDQIRAAGLDVDILGRGYAPFEDKADGLAPYRYSLVIENVAEPGHFTEKIVDACLCRTVPIYWGAPDIADWFDARGLIVCRSAGEMLAALDRLSAEDYEQRAAAVEANRQLALHYADTHGRAAKVLASDRGEAPPFPT
jgi:hypothetical protein